MSFDLGAAACVSAVIVSHNGEQFLPRLLEALEDSATFPTQLVAVDTGSSDTSRSLLVAALGADAVVDAPRHAGFGEAVAAGLATLPPADGPAERCWVWLLHDDCAPDPDTLRELVAVATSDSGIAVVGPRVRAWPRARRLLEVGVTISGTGHRETGLEPGEYDQGQHDDRSDVLAVGSAGMLVRRDVWDRLGGFDARLPLFRDDVDFGWRVARSGGRVVVAPAALLFHAEAATRGARDIDNTNASPHRADRRAALYTLLVNCRAAAVPWQYLRLTLGSLLRALAYLIGKLPGAARDEVRAMASVVVRPHVIWKARRQRRPHATAPRSQWRPLLPSWWTPYLHGLDSVLSQVSAGLRDRAATVASSARRLRSGRGDATALETGPAADDSVNLPVGAGPVAWVRDHPLVSLTTVLTLAAFVATRGLHGAGFLQGGALLPVPASSGSWWQLYTETWHPVGLGSDIATAPYVAVLAAFGTLLVGKSWLVIDLLLLFAVPLSGIGAYALARRLVSAPLVRVWAATSYAVLFAVTGVATSGHLGTVAAGIWLPWVVRAAIPLLTSPTGAGWRAAAATGLALSVLVAFAPVSWPIAVVLAVAGATFLVATGRARRVGPLAFAVLLPLVLLVPWSWRLMTEPSLVLTEAGRVHVGVSAVQDHAWQLPFGRLDAAGAAPWWVTAGLLIAAVVALLRPDRLTRVAAAWVVVAVGLAAIAVLSQLTVAVPGTYEEAYVWAGFPVLLVQGAVIAAAAIAADGLGEVVRSGSFGWRQPVAAVTTALALTAPLLGLAWWVGVAPHGDLDRRAATTLPAYMVDAMRADTQLRLLVIRSGESPFTYYVTADDGRRLGDDSVLPEEPDDRLTALVQDLVSAGRPSDVRRLAEKGIAYVVLPRPSDPGAVAELDAQPGLSRASTNSAVKAAWQVEAPEDDGAVVDDTSNRGRWLLLQAGAVVVVMVLAAPGFLRTGTEEPE